MGQSLVALSVSGIPEADWRMYEESYDRKKVEVIKT